MIRKTQLDDLPVIWELMNDLECIEFPYELFCDAFEAVYSNPYMHMFVYEANKTVLGCLNMRIDVHPSQWFYRRNQRFCHECKLSW